MAIYRGEVSPVLDPFVYGDILVVTGDPEEIISKVYLDIFSHILIRDRIIIIVYIDMTIVIYASSAHPGHIKPLVGKRGQLWLLFSLEYI